MSEVDLARVRSFIKEFVFVRNEVPHISHHQEQWSFLLCRFWQYSGLKHPIRITNNDTYPLLVNTLVPWFWSSSQKVC